VRLFIASGLLDGVPVRGNERQKLGIGCFVTIGRAVGLILGNP